jgi:hypothetical protein
MEKIKYLPVFLLISAVLLFKTGDVYAQIDRNSADSRSPIWIVLLLIVLVLGGFIVTVLLYQKFSKRLKGDLLRKIKSEGIILKEKNVKISFTGVGVLGFGKPHSKWDIYLTNMGLYIVDPYSGEYGMVVSNRYVPGLIKLLKRYSIKDIDVRDRNLIIKTPSPCGTGAFKLGLTQPEAWKDKIQQLIML